MATDMRWDKIIIIIIIIIIINNVYYYRGTITKLYAARPPYSVKSRNHQLAYNAWQQVRACQ